MIKFKDGNILNAEENIICHQTNCIGVMGGGLALQIRNKYPEVYNCYKKLCSEFKPNELLGKIQIVKVEGNNKYIVNLFGQNNISKTTRMTDYDALEVALNNLKTNMELQDEKLSVAIPYNIGCALGGGDWSIVSKIISDVFKDSEIDVVIYSFDPNSGR